MTKVLLTSLELSDIKKVVEEVLERKLNSLNFGEPKSLKLLTRKETAKTLCISLPTLHEWTKTGSIVGYRIGNRILYKQEEVIQSLTQIKTLKSRGGVSC